MPHTKKYCEWCHGTTNVMAMYIPETPVLEWLEEKLIAIDNDFVDKELTKDEEWELLVYDEMVKSIRKGNVCKKCWQRDQYLYEKYYNEDDEDNYLRLI